MATSNHPKYPRDLSEEERDDSSYSDRSDSSDLDCDSDSDADPSFSVLDETNHKLSALSLRKKYRSRTLKDYGAEDDVEDGMPGDGEVLQRVDKMVKDGQVEKLKLDECKAYLRKHGLRLSGCKGTLIERIKEHQEVLDGRGEQKYPLSSFVINCKGDACTNDVVLFEQNVYDMFNIASRSASGPPCGKRIVAGRIVKESYGAAKQQHTFTIEVLWCKGEKALPPLHPLLIKGRNLYRLKTLRQRWQDEEERSRVLREKHSRGFVARSNRETRILEKEKKKLMGKGRVSRKDSSRKHIDIIRSAEPAKLDMLMQQPSTAVSSEIMAGQRKLLGKGPNEDVKSATFIQPPHHQPSNGTTLKGESRHQVPYYLEPRKMIPQDARPNDHTTKHERDSMRHGSDDYWNNNRSSLDRYHHTSFRRELSPTKYNRHPFARMDNRSAAGPLYGQQAYNHQQLCKHYPLGRCYFGEGCKFSHQHEEVPYGHRKEPNYGGGLYERHH